jgi:hypothetical protein
MRREGKYKFHYLRIMKEAQVVAGFCSCRFVVFT